MLTEGDVRYITANFRPLEELCHGRRETPEDVRALIRAGKLPRATYTLDDGTEVFPPDYFALADAAGGIDALSREFERRFIAAAEAEGGLRFPKEVDEEWAAYLSGEYGACLRAVTPENIVRKDRLVAKIEGLLESPRPDDSAWRDALRASVDELDELELEFAPYDRVRWGPVSRDRLVTLPRERYPAAFAARGEGAVA